MNRMLTAAAAIGVAGAGVLAPVAARAATGCATHWGSTAKLTQSPASSGRPTVVSDLRAGRHACFDRLVLDLSAGTPPTSVGYVPEVLADPSGKVLHERGGAFLHVVVRGVANPSDAGEPAYGPANSAELVDVAGFRTLRQVAAAGNFEGHASFGAGVRARLPFRTFVLAGPGGHSRLVIDVAHTW